MLELIHGDVPYKLKKRQEKETPIKPKKAWTSFGRGNGKTEIRDNLYPLQKGLCVYCEEQLDKYGFHIEHILSKDKNHRLTFEYTNLSLSCMKKLDELEKNYGITKESRSCGHSILKSENQYIEILFIKPTEKKCNLLFSYISNGKITYSINSSDFNKLRINHTIKVLNLDCRRLERDRREILEEIYKAVKDLQYNKEALNDFITLELDRKPSFISAREEHYKIFQ